jgi:3'-5' exonuclease
MGFQDRTEMVVMRTLVVDIETASVWKDLSPAVQARLTERHAKMESRLPMEERTHPADVAALSPWTGKVIVIAIWDTEKARGWVLYEGQKTDVARIDGGWRYEACGDERGLLEAFWTVLRRNQDARIAGFNSRGFDGVFIHVRSFILGIQASRNLVPYRYSTKEHLDLHDVLGLWTSNRTPSLDVVCEVAGIPSPKSEMSGADVEDAYAEGRILDVARYCAGDVRATADAVARWEETNGPVFGERKKW